MLAPGTDLNNKVNEDRGAEEEEEEEEELAKCIDKGRGGEWGKGNVMNGIPNPTRNPWTLITKP